MQDIRQETHHETTRLTQSAQVVLWEIDLTEVGGERYFFCNEQNEKVSRSPGRGGSIRYTLFRGRDLN